MSTAPDGPRKAPFLCGVFLIACAVLVLQIVQSRILSVIAWYHLAFFAISVAMLGMTAGAVYAYRRADRFHPDQLAADLTRGSLAAAISMPISMVIQFTLLLPFTPTVTTLAAWSLLLAAMAVPYALAGTVLSLALTRSPFPVGQVYGVDLLGAALGCAGVVVLLNHFDGYTTVVLAGLMAGVAAWCFDISHRSWSTRPWWQRPLPVCLALLTAAILNALVPVGIRPLMVKGRLETSDRGRFEQWNSYSRIVALPPGDGPPTLWGPSPTSPPRTVRSAGLHIDGEAGTVMHAFDGTVASVDFLRYDLVNLAYHLPGIGRAAVIGVGGGRDLLSAHVFGVRDIVGVELNPIFVGLHTTHPVYSRFSNVTSLPNLRLHVDDARSWFAATRETFDLVQMSMIDTWAATGAGAFSLSENGLYTLEGWRAFLRALTPDGIFTVSRWFDPNNADETGRMIGLATAALLDAGVADPAQHMVVAHTRFIATLVLSKSPFTETRLTMLTDAVRRLEFGLLLAPNRRPDSPLLAAMVESRDIAALNAVASSAALDLTVPTDDRPFFFNQLRFSRIPAEVQHLARGGRYAGVIRGNLMASATLLMILFISIVAVAATIVLPLRAALESCPKPLIAPGTAYFSLIGMGFMLGEIALLQSFSVFLGHPTYSLGVCLFALILAAGLGSLASNRLDPAASPTALLVWGIVIVAYLLLVEQFLPSVFLATTARGLGTRIAISLSVLMPLGFLLGFAFPTGMRLVEAVDKAPTPWFWGINGATGVLASVVAVMLSMALGIHATLLTSAACYAALVPVGLRLMRLARAASPRALGR